MYQKTTMDTTRFSAVLAIGIVMLVTASLLTSNIPALAFSNYFFLPHRKEISIGFFSVGVLFGILAADRYFARVHRPWKVPQSQATIAYTAFFVSFAVAIAFSH